MKNKALFLDRDGVINIDHGYVSSVENFQFVDGVFELCRAAKRLNYLIVVVTNQSGIGRGYYSEREFEQLSEWMRRQFIYENCPIDKQYHCPFHPEFGVGEYKNESFDRKPNPGMVLQAQADLDIDLKRSIIVGDSETDIICGQAAGIGVTVRFAEGGILTSSVRATHTFSKLVDVVGLLV